MSSFVFYEFDVLMATEGYGFTTNADNLYVRLLNSNFFEGPTAGTAQTTYSTYSEIEPYLVPYDGGYIEKKLSGVNLDVSTKTKVVLKSTDVNWYPTSLSARGAVVYDGANNLICVIDFGQVQTTVSGTFLLPFSKGIIQIR